MPEAAAYRPAKIASQLMPWSLPAWNSDEVAHRTLCHGLVHATQMARLGMDRYTDLYVRGFVKSRSWIAIPLEAQAYQPDTRFAMSPPTLFSAEDEVKSWAKQGRY
jgi:hypothetical protein